MKVDPGTPLIILALLALLFAAKIGHIGAAIWLHTGYCGAVGRMRYAYVNSRRRCLAVGFINLFVLIFLTLVLLGNEPLGLLGLILGGFVVALSVVGYSLAYAEMGDRIAGDGSAPTWKRILIGGTACEMLYLAPVLGQVLSFGAWCRGFGAVVLTLVGRRGPGDSD
jgi:hypothetical protein